MYSDTGRKREDPLTDKRKPTTTMGSGSGLPTPELETKKLPAEPPRDNTREMSSTSQGQTTSPSGKAPERKQIPDITPTDDMKSIGAILSAIKQNVAKFENALEGLGKQATALTALHAPLKLQEEYQTVRQELQQQIQRQKEEMKQKREELENLLRRQLDEKIKKKIDAEVHEIVKQKVADRMQAELDRLIPQKLKGQSLLHRERMQHIRSGLINNEARRRNANAGRTGQTLHRLVVSRPATISRSSSGSTATPSTAHPTPLDSESLLFSNARNQPPDDDTYSPVFPRSSQELFSCYHKGRKMIQQLLEEYEGPEVSIDITNDLQVIDAIDRLGHNFGILGPKDHLIIPPGSMGGQPLSPLIMSAD